MNIAMIAHDSQKKEMVNFTFAYKHFLQNHSLISTKTTGEQIREKTKLNVKCVLPGPLGGYQEIGGLVGRNEIDMIIFFRDPLTAKAHEPDINELQRLSDVFKIPMATNMGTAEILVKSLNDGNMEWRNIVQEDRNRELVKQEALLRGIQLLMNGR
ncbi:methylglyoxal synthase [Bacillus sp. B1-b2]|uniref:methylglyoxal synthase n=1 Tax=Bacillus sp. B1-b2 TaxID=2653201 RepID=UPI0012621BD3|nr:methylglyoxal synthase [Bacillus sp. B1-b2]KAB7672115.1 methylglyoxal synthase [Bacillus sp. B1-b2]